MRISVYIFIQIIYWRHIFSLADAIKVFDHIIKNNIIIINIININTIVVMFSISL
jgi:hypothetical protein